MKAVSKNIKLSIIPDFSDPNFRDPDLHNQREDALPRMRKETLTISISPELAEQLEEVRFYAGKLLSREKRKRLTKSQFYELIFEDVIKNHQALGSESNLWKLTKEWADEQVF